MRSIIKDELTQLREDYKDERRTQIVKEEAEISLEDLIAEEEVVVTISHAGYIKRNAVSLYRAQRRGGKGKIGMGIKDEDFVETLFTASTHDTLLFFTDAGKVFWLKVHEIPEAGRAAKGKAMVNLLALAGSEKVTATLPVKDFPDDRFVVMATKKGVIKKTELVRLQQSATGRHHRARAGRRRQADRRAGHRWTAGDSPRHQAGHHHPLLGEGRAADGTHGARRKRHHAGRGQ